MPAPSRQGRAALRDSGCEGEEGLGAQSAAPAELQGERDWHPKLQHQQSSRESGAGTPSSIRTRIPGRAPAEEPDSQPGCVRADTHTPATSRNPRGRAHRPGSTVRGSMPENSTGPSARLGVSGRESPSRGADVSRCPTAERSRVTGRAQVGGRCPRRSPRAQLQPRTGAPDTEQVGWRGAAGQAGGGVPPQAGARRAAGGPAPLDPPLPPVLPPAPRELTRPAEGQEAQRGAPGLAWGRLRHEGHPRGAQAGSGSSAPDGSGVRSIPRCADSLSLDLGGKCSIKIQFGAFRLPPSLSPPPPFSFPSCC